MTLEAHRNFALASPSQKSLSNLAIDLCSKARNKFTRKGKGNKLKSDICIAWFKEHMKKRRLSSFESSPGE
jgi:hypothetical protein